MINNNETVLLNITQVRCYLLDDIKPLRIELSDRDRKLLFIYDKEETKEVFDKWRNKEYDLSVFDLTK